MEHRRAWENHVFLSNAKGIGQRHGEGMQDYRPVRIDDALGLTRGPGCVAHGGSGVFVDGGVREFRWRASQKRLVALGHDEDALEVDLIAKFLEYRDQGIVDDQEAVLGVIGDVGQFARMQTQIERMHDAACRWDAEVGFKVNVLVPHERGHAIAGPQSGGH